VVSSLTEFTNRDTKMISPQGRRGKGIGLADRPVVPAVPCRREPMDRQAGDLAAVRFKTAQ
jgi:hypothetical protein